MDDFRLTVQDTFQIRGRGFVVTGKVESGELAVGQTIQIASPDGLEHYETKVMGLEAFHQQIRRAEEGQDVGILLAGLTKDQVKAGMVVTVAS